MKTNSNKQVAAFDQVLGHCNALGEKYNPSMESMKVAALKSLLTSAQSSITAVDTAKVNLIRMVNARQKAFSTIAGVATRIVNMLVAADASPQLIEDVKRYRDKLVSRRAKKTIKPEDSTNTMEPADTSRGPVSYLDFESRAVNFGTIISLIQAEPLYNPNEEAFSIVGLKSLLSSLRNASNAVYDAQVNLRNARLARRMALYGDTGLYGASMRVKKYILFVFGARSEQHRMFTGIKLKSVS